MTASLSRGRLIPTVALALLAIAGTRQAARAGDAPFQADAKFELVSAQGTHYYFDGAGHARGYGSFDAAIETQANNGNFDESGVMTLDFGKGDTLTIYFEDEWVPDLGARVGPYVITGGTGRLAGATGSGTLTGIPNGDGTGRFSLDGTISW